MFFRLNKNIYYAFLFVVIFAGNNVMALELGKVRVNGYLTQNFLYTEGNNYLGDTKNGSFDYGEAAVNFFYRPSNRSFVSAQLLSRNIGNFYESQDDLKLEYGVFGYSLLSQRQVNVNVRAGRIKYPYGLYNDVRGVSSAIPSVILPQVMYYDYSRIGLLLDGLQLESSFRLESFGDIMLGVTLGKSTDQQEDLKLSYDSMKLYINTIAANTGLDMSNLQGSGGIHNLPILRLRYHSPDGRLTLGLSKTMPHMAKVTVGNSVGKYDIDINMSSINYSIEYSWDKFSIMAERNQLNNFYNHVLSVYAYGGVIQEIDTSLRSDAYYLQTNYQFSDKWDAYLRHEQYYPNRYNKSGSELPVAYYGYSKGWIIGGTYHFSDNLFIRAEFHNIEGAALLNTQVAAVDNQDADVYDNYWSIFAMQVSYSF